MKKLIACLALGLMTTGVIAQQSESKTDDRLLARFSATEVASMQQENPAKLDFWVFYLDHGYTVQEMPKGKGTDLPVVDIDENAFNILALDLEPQSVGNRYFRIKSSGKLLALHPYADVEKMMKSNATK